MSSASRDWRFRVKVLYYIIQISWNLPFVDIDKFLVLLVDDLREKLMWEGAGEDFTSSVDREKVTKCLMTL